MQLLGRGTALILILVSITNAQNQRAAGFDSLINASIVLSEQALFAANFDEAERYIDTFHFRRFESFQETHNLKLTIQYFRIQSFKNLLYVRKHDWDEELRRLLELRAVATRLDDKTILGDYYGLPSSCLRAMGKSDSASYFENRELQLYEEAGNISKVAKVRGEQISRRHNNLQAAGDSEGVLKLVSEYEKEIEFARSCGNLYALAYNTRHLAQIHRQQTQNYDEALRLFQISLELREEIGFKVLLPASYSSIGDVSSKMGQKDKAVDMYHRSIALADEIGFVRYQFYPRITLGDLYRSEGDFSEARRYYVEALKAASRNNYEDGVDAALEKLADLAN